MYPHERSLVQKLESKPFVLLGVNSDSDRNKAKGAVASEKLTWRSFWNGSGGTSGPISSAWQIQGWPTLYVIDDRGVIRYKFEGGGKRVEAEIDKAIDTLLKEMGAL
jgi:hypothetical protein